jgi:hypothetical protein
MFMHKFRQPKLLDIVAVLSAPAEVDVEVGDVGTVVELLPLTGLRLSFSTGTAEPVRGDVDG